MCVTRDCDHELDLPVGVDRQLDCMRRPDDAARPLGEHRRLLRNTEDALLRVGSVVQADCKDLWRSRHWSMHVLQVDLACTTGVDRLAPLGETLPVLEHSLWVGRE